MVTTRSTKQDWKRYTRFALEISDLRYLFWEFVGVLLMGLLYCEATVQATLSVGIVKLRYLQPPSSTMLIHVDMGCCHT